MLTQAQLKRLLRYNSTTGVFYWRVTAGGAIAGARAGSLKKRLGYWRIGIGGKVYADSRLAWLYVYGRFPERDLDHKNRIKTDCRIANLRLATESQNNANARLRKDNSHGHKGVTRHHGKWRARVMHNGRRINLGVFDTPQAAHAAYCQAAKKLHGAFFYSG